MKREVGMMVRYPFRGLMFLCFVCSLAGCDSVSRGKERLDDFFFGLSGGTIFSDPYQVSLKQLHFDTGELFGKDVVFEGTIAERGESFTYVVVVDGDGRMLVVLTQIEDAHRRLNRSDVKGLRVLGRLERGKKGLPYIMARSIRIVEEGS